MGNSSLRLSRNCVVDLEKITKNRTIDFYSSDAFLKKDINCQYKDRGTVNIDLDVFKKSFIDMVKKTGLSKINILEVGSGNGHNSLFVKSLIEKDLKVDLTFIATDLQEHPDQEMKIHKLPAEKAVQKHGNESNVLLLISPPPNCYMDYYAIKEFESSKSDPKYIIYFGELGASDGGNGMYQYMMNLSKWSLLQREMIYDAKDSLGGPLEKELFLFKYDSSKIPKSIDELLTELEIKGIRDFINEDSPKFKFTPKPEEFNSDDEGNSIPLLDIDNDENQDQEETKQENQITTITTSDSNDVSKNDISLDNLSESSSLEAYLEGDHKGIAVNILKQLMGNIAVDHYPLLLKQSMDGKFSNGKSHVSALLEDMFKEHQ